jgi:hypothetical protein
MAKVAHQWGMQEINVEMQDIKLAGVPANFLKHDHVIRQRIFDRGIKTQCHVATPHEARRCLGIAAGE